ncbi:hypothetical protein B5E67_09230 [Faecalibacterium sp. An122]|nr:hypothetical protein B5E67_09230 [Faecalibacterium sp. An122]
MEDSFFYEHPPRARRQDNLVEFPTGQTRPSQRPGEQRTRNGARPQQVRPGRSANGARRPAQARPSASAPRREGRRRRRLTRKMLRRRRMMRRLTAVFLVLCVAAAGVYLTVTMLFKINAIRVAGPDGATLTEAGPYTSSQILETLGVQVEENIFSFDPGEKAAMLEKTFPLLEQIEVKRVYPSTVVVQVTPATPAYTIQTSTGWINLSAGLKILSTETQQPDLLVLYGGDPVSVTPGDQLAYALADPALSGADSAEASSAADSESAALAQDGRIDALTTLLTALEERGLLGDVTRIEYADVEEIAFLYQDRISVLLGTLNELDYKLDYAEYMLLNKEGKGCAETDTGQLDCSHVKTDGTLQAIFAQGVPELPSGYVVPEEVPVPDTETTDPALTGETAAEGAPAGETGADPAADPSAQPADPAAENQAAGDGTAPETPAEGTDQ